MGTMGTMDHYGVHVVLLQAVADGPGIADAYTGRQTEWHPFLNWQFNKKEVNLITLAWDSMGSSVLSQVQMATAM